MKLRILFSTQEEKLMLKYAFQIGPKRSRIGATVEGNRVARGINILEGFP